MTSPLYPRRFIVHAHRRLSRSEFEDMRAYARLTTSQMESEARSHEAYVEKAVASLSAEEREAYFENNADSYDLLVRRFPNQQQQSLIVLGYTVLEARLVRIVRTLLATSEIGLTLKDLSGDSPFQKSRKVITKVAKFQVAPELWDCVEAYRLVRNAIVHSAGDLGPDPHQLVKLLLQQRPTEIQFSEQDGLVIQPAFLLGFLDVSERLLEAIFTAWLESVPASAA